MRDKAPPGPDDPDQFWCGMGWGVLFASALWVVLALLVFGVVALLSP